MKRLKFTSAHGQSHVETPDVSTGRTPCAHEGCNEQGGWHDGDIKSVSDSDAEILLTNPQFADAGGAAPQPTPSGAYERPVIAASASSEPEEE